VSTDTTSTGAIEGTGPVLLTKLADLSSDPTVQPTV